MRRITSLFVSADGESSAILTGMVAAMLIVAFSVHSLEAEAAYGGFGFYQIPLIRQATLLHESIDNIKNIASETESAESKHTSITASDEIEILWFARAIYSETKRASEQKLVAWAIRNRVDTAFRGNTTYKNTVLDPRQFSGLNSSDGLYSYNISRDRSYTGPAWQNALKVAEEVYSASDSARPFGQSVRHFYSPQAVSKDPAWSVGRDATVVITDPTTSRERFAFYAGVR